MSLYAYLRGQVVGPWNAWSQRRLARQLPATNLDRADWPRSLREPLAFYLDCVRYFHHRLPREIREHRAYFHNVPGDRRGFGEDAFHTMWHLLTQEFKPGNFLEIGIFRGQVISLLPLLARLSGRRCESHGISPFSSAGDSVSVYAEAIEYYEDTRLNFRHFNLEPPQLLRAQSTDPKAVQLISSRSWDMIYIDGNHDYDVAKQDWVNCSQNLRPNGVIVLDDAGLTTAYRCPLFASRGHPGPSRVAQEIDRELFREVLQVGHNRVFLKSTT